ncbi:MAG TPA: DHHA1 domain-containing protein, partial [Candidatus Saccharimonadales bacterium]|nr:DHHA1 domain-containing protein [Candidatus Saccharimonadales bacterium]
ISKASARSVAGFNIIEFIRSASTLLVNAGGHPMAAGFTIETEKILLLQEKLEQLAEKSVDGDMLTRVVKIDCALPVEGISQNMYDALQTLAPFGMGNFEPTFTSEVVVTDIKKVGQDGKHLKLVVGPVIASGDEKSPSTRLGVMFPAIAFGQGELGSKIKAGETIQIAYTIDENVWRDKKSLQLKIKDIHLH